MWSQVSGTRRLSLRSSSHRKPFSELLQALKMKENGLNTGLKKCTDQHLFALREYVFCNV